MGGILVYALHDDEGEFNKNSLGALSEASKLAGELGGEAAAVVVGDVSDDAAAGLGKYGVKKVYRAKDAPEGLAQPIVDVMAKVMQDNVVRAVLRLRQATALDQLWRPRDHGIRAPFGD